MILNGGAVAVIAHYHDGDVEPVSGWITFGILLGMVLGYWILSELNKE